MSRPWLRHGARCVPVPVVRQKWLRWVTPRPMLFRGLCEQGPSSAGSPCRSTGAASAPDPGAQIGSQIILFRRNWSDLQLTRHPRTDRSSRPRSMCGDEGYCAAGFGEGDKFCLGWSGGAGLRVHPLVRVRSNRSTPTPALPSRGREGRSRDCDDGSEL